MLQPIIRLAIREATSRLLSASWIGQTSAIAPATCISSCSIAGSLTKLAAANYTLGKDNHGWYVDLLSGNALHNALDRHKRL